MYRGIGDIIWRVISLYSKMFPLAKQSGGSHSVDYILVSIRSETRDLTKALK